LFLLILQHRLASILLASPLDGKLPDNTLKKSTIPAPLRISEDLFQIEDAINTDRKSLLIQLSGFCISFAKRISEAFNWPFYNRPQNVLVCNIFC